jgi:hypothetical protein
MKAIGGIQVSRAAVWITMLAIFGRGGDMIRRVERFTITVLLTAMYCHPALGQVSTATLKVELASRRIATARDAVPQADRFQLH